MQTTHQRGGFQTGLCPLLDNLLLRGGFFRGVKRVFAAGGGSLTPELLIGLGRRDLSHLLVRNVTGGAGRLRVPDLLIGLRRRDLSRLLVDKITGGAGRRCLACWLIPKRVEKILLGGRVL